MANHSQYVIQSSPICNSQSDSQSESVEYLRQKAQAVEHLTRDSGCPGSNPNLFCNYFSHLITQFKHVEFIIQTD